MAKIRENRVKRKLQRGEVASVALGPNTSTIIDFLGSIGMDAAWLEGEHGDLDYGAIPDMSRACDLWGMTSIARVNRNTSGVIYRTLDGGAQGIVVPHVNTAEDAQAVVDAGKFHPLGSRGMFKSRQGYGVDDYFARANDETLLMVLIEDIAAVENLAEILTVDHIDVFHVAPSDLAQSMGLLGQHTLPEVQAVIDQAIEQIVKAGRTAGTLVTDANVEDYIKKGVRFVGTSWQTWLEAGARGFMDKVAAASNS